MNTTECTAIKVGPTQWMVRRWKPPLTEEKLNPYLTGGMLAPFPQYVEALITGNFTGSGEAIKSSHRPQLLGVKSSVKFKEKK